MPRLTCRCGQALNVPANGPERVLCPGCGARIRVRRDPPAGGSQGDGFVRFSCDCGRRLKVRAGSADALQAGQCPDCGRVVTVPAAAAPAAGSASSSGGMKLKTHGPETPTEELDPADLAALDRWARRHLPAPAPEPLPLADEDPALAVTSVIPAPEPAPEPAKTEVGLRVCARCGRPLHLKAETCRGCGAPAPRR